MVVIHILAKAQSDKITTFEPLLRSVIQDALATQGCIKYEWYRVPDVANHFVIYGEFNSEENFREYLASPVVKRIGVELMPLLEGPPEFKHLRASVLEEH